jgi:hypothetical protein
VRVAEREVARLPELLEPLRDRARQMGENALLEWERWFSPTNELQALVDALLVIRARGKTDHITAAREKAFTSVEIALRPARAANGEASSREPSSCCYLTARPFQPRVNHALRLRRIALGPSDPIAAITSGAYRH